MQFWVLSAFLGLVFLMGGGSRADIPSLVILRPLAVLICGFGFWNLNLNQLGEHRFLVLFAAALFLVVGLQLVPLPPSIWTNLPGHEVVAEIDRTVGTSLGWRPISMVPTATLNALFSLFVPLAVLLLGIQLRREERFQLLPVFIGLGVSSGVMGLLQVASSSTGPLYLYQITNNGSAVGLFSNRNHQALFLACLFPMLAVFACVGLKTVEQWRFRLWISVAAGVVILPLLLVTGSRAGLLIGLVGLGLSPLLYRKPLFESLPKRKIRRMNLAYVFIGFAVITLGLITVLFARAQAFQRLVAPDQAEDLRFSIWHSATPMAWKYFPFGSGIGTFAEVYQIDEPLAGLSPGYVNHAHNDWLEVIVTGGFPGVSLLAIAVIAWASEVRTAFRASASRNRETSYAKLGYLLVLLLALGSLGDYPLRVPSVMSILTIAAIWSSGASRKPVGADRVDSNRDGSPGESRLAAKLHW